MTYRAAGRFWAVDLELVGEGTLWHNMQHMGWVTKVKGELNVLVLVKI